MQANTITTNLVSYDLIVELNSLSHQSIEACYHCHKCAAGCPIIEDMQYGPDQILRMIALEERETILSSRDIWLCAGCNTCVVHCPNEIDVSAVMDALRYLSVTKGFKAGEPDILLFHRLFLTVVRNLGQSHEAVMLGLFKVLSHTPILADVKAGIRLFLRGKVPLLPPRFPPIRQMGSIIRRDK